MKPPFQLGPVISAIVMATFVVAGCAKSPPAATPMAAAADAPAAATPDTTSNARAADLAAKEQELAAREAVLKQQELEAELAKRDAENAAAAVATAKQQAAKQAASKPVVVKTSATAAAPKPAAPPPKPIAVPAGTTLAVQVSEMSTKASLVGDHVDARLASDLMIDGRRAAKAGASVQGSVVKIVSGSKKIGSTPVLKIHFDTLVAADGQTVTINAPYVQKGTSDTGKDTAKILGGAAAGAIIGHQVSHDNGAVVGGLLGGAAGTAAAYKTGGEITLEDGQVLTVVTGAAFEVRP